MLFKTTIGNLTCTNKNKMFPHTYCVVVSHYVHLVIAVQVNEYSLSTSITVLHVCVCVLAVEDEKDSFTFTSYFSTSLCICHRADGSKRPT